MTTNNATAHYKAVFDQWQVKLAGPKPTADQLTVAHAFGRPGKQTLALGMMLRPDGATASQIKQASAMFDGNPTPHFNKMRELVIGGYFTREPTPGAFTIKLTAKGNAYIKNKAKGADEATTQAKAKPEAKAITPAKAKPASKPRKPKAPVSTAHVTEPATPEIMVPQAPVNDGATA